MRKLVFALLLLCSALFATAQEWQWSVQLKGFISSETGKEPTAFLWIPSDCHQLRAVMVGKHNMSEETLFEMPRFREALSRMGIGLVWITPGIDQQWDVTKGTQVYFAHLRWLCPTANVGDYGEIAQHAGFACQWRGFRQSGPRPKNVGSQERQGPAWYCKSFS